MCLIKLHTVFIVGLYGECPVGALNIENGNVAINNNQPETALICPRERFIAKSLHAPWETMSLKN